MPSRVVVCVMQSVLETEPVAGRGDPDSRTARRRAPLTPDRWEQRLADLSAFKAAHGHCNVPSGYEEDPSLAVWVFNCRRQRKQGKLDAARVERLDAIGFAWAVRTRRFVARDWDAMVAQLEAFRSEHGHSNVPNAWPRNPELAAWLHGVRCNRRSGRLDALRMRQLDVLGVVWEPQQTRWETFVAALAEYRERHGDCNVPCGWPQNVELAKWVKGVRAARKRGDLDVERITRLDQLGFGWERGGDQRWDEMFAELAEYRRAHGHCRISTLSQDCPALGNWVHTQRTLRKQGRLEDERVEQLDALGFTWDLRREQWETMFAALLDYRRATGHCDVPQTWSANRKLGNWVMMQRTAYKANRLDAEQIERLLAIGFHFSLAGDRILVAQPEKPRTPARPQTRRAA